MNQSNIRNFCIIAHIDHGKSTLADRFLEITKTVEDRKMRARALDTMDLEQEKGITIKLKAVRMNYKDHQLNLIDTPGHVDFSYEVSRSLAACEGALLLVDASKGIQAQTVSNVYKALEADLKIIPVINKIDLKSSEEERVSQDLIETFGFEKDEIFKVSAKTGENVEKLLDIVIHEVPPPSGEPRDAPRALIFDTFYDEYTGVIAAVRVVDGGFSSKMIPNRKKIEMKATEAKSIPEEIGIFVPERKKIDKLNTGEVGYIATGLKDIKQVRVGDTVVLEGSAEEAGLLPGYKEVKPFVFVSIYPIDNDKFSDLRDALEKIALSDAALTYEPASNTALGFGFRCGFLGLLHADIIQERLEREYNLELISTTPSVEYEVLLTNGETKKVRTASEFPKRTRIEEVREPWILLNIVAPSEYIGDIMTLCERRRGIQKDIQYPSEERVIFEYEMPLSELIFNLFDDMKTISSGFASLDYEFLEYRSVEVVKLDILVHKEVVDPLSRLVLKDRAEDTGRKVLIKLKDIIPKQQFSVALQAAIRGNVVAREDIPAMRKNVLEGIYGGHRERKDKLLERQKEGKKRLKKIGNVDIPQEAFRQILES